MNNKISFENEHRAFVYLFCGLITLCAFPVLAWHYLTTLEGFAVLAIGGLLATDAVMWFAGHWSVKTNSVAMRAVSLIVKFVIAGVAVSIASVAILLMRSEHQADKLMTEQTRARTAEIRQRTDAAKELAQVQGGRSAAREIVKMSDAKTAGDIAATERASLQAKIPAWFLDFGIYAFPPLTAILGALVLTITATVIKKRETEAEGAEHQKQAGNILPWRSQKDDAGITQARSKANFDLKETDIDAIKDKRSVLPGKNRTDAKPPAPDGFEFSPQARGFVCRRVTVENGKRKRTYHGYLNAARWQEMKGNHSGLSLRSAVEKWINGVA